MRNDVLLDENYDLIQSDDGYEWVEGDSDETDAELNILCEPGTNREFPFAGFGINKRINERYDPNSFIRDMQVCLENDGFINPKVSLNNDGTFKIQIDGTIS